MAWYNGSASLIKVDPSLLQSSGKDIQSNGQTILSVIKSVQAAANSVCSIDPQFDQLLSAIGNEAFARANRLIGDLSDIGERVVAKGTEFEATDLAAITALDPIFNENALLELWSKITGLSIQELEQILKLATLLGNPALFFSLVFAIIFDQHAPISSPPSTSSPQQKDKFAEINAKAKREAEQKGQEKIWKQTEIENQIKGSQGNLPSDPEYKSCVDWAIARTATLGGPELRAIGNYPHSDLGAHNYIQIFSSSVIKINPSDVSGSSINISGLKPGAALVWDKGNTWLEVKGKDPYHGYQYGHIAIVEAVQPNGVWVSQANSPASVKFYAYADLYGASSQGGLYVIPPGAKPG